ncbi:MAG: low molecular weight phosphatase family protein [Acidobacteria bacterium]|nr:low molecular weight phosphatase family protein [Acidobacteriota bacterium]
MSKFRPREPVSPGPSGPRKRVLFVCIGNICRSPMAEAFARHYGSDVMAASSAGLSPALNCTPQIRTVMAEKNVDVGNHLPRALDEVDLGNIDLIVNMSGFRLPSPGVRVIDWKVEDPIGASDEVYRRVRDDIESKVIQLVLRLRSGKD